MILKLRDLASISSGITFRSSVKVSEAGNVRLIRMKDLSKDNMVCLEQTARIDYARPRQSQLVMMGDIFFRSRGQTNTAALLERDAPDTIFSAPLIRIRPDTQKVAPAFLWWWINQRSSQVYIKSILAGTSLKMVNKEGLEELEVVLPPLERQHKLAEFFRLAMQEQHLLERIKQCKAAYTHGVLLQLATAAPLIALTKNLDRAAASTLG